MKTNQEQFTPHSTRPQVTRQILAEHEASHAVMRVLLLRVATQTWINPDGGYSESTGRRISTYALLLIILAGFAWEEKGNPICLVLSRANDLDCAEDILRESCFFRLRISARTKKPYRVSVERALNGYLRMAWRILSIHEKAVLEVASQLVEHGEIGPKAIRRIVRSCRPKIISDPEVAEILSYSHLS